MRRPAAPSSALYQRRGGFQRSPAEHLPPALAAGPPYRPDQEVAYPQGPGYPLRNAGERAGNLPEILEGVRARDKRGRLFGLREQRQDTLAAAVRIVP